MSVIVPNSSALPLKADVAAVGRESPKLTHSGNYDAAHRAPKPVTKDTLTIVAAVYEGHRYARELDTEIDPDGAPFKAVKYELELGG